MNIGDWRRKIDEIDRKLVELLNERSRCALEIGRLKRAAQMPLYQPEREREVLEAAEGANRGPLPDTAIRRLFERILDEARSVERAIMRDKRGQRKQSVGSGIPSEAKKAERTRLMLRTNSTSCHYDQVSLNSYLSKKSAGGS